MNVVHTVGLLAQSTVVYMKRVALRNRLMGLNDNLLEDIGVSRELLEQGVKAYPWHIETEDDAFVTFDVSKLVVMSSATVADLPVANDRVALKELPQAA